MKCSVIKRKAQDFSIITQRQSSNLNFELSILVFSIHQAGFLTSCCLLTENTAIPSSFPYALDNSDVNGDLSLNSIIYRSPRDSQTKKVKSQSLIFLMISSDRLSTLRISYFRMEKFDELMG